MKKSKTHTFTVVVSSNGTQRSAEAAILAAFSARHPDGCEFRLLKRCNYRDAYMAGATSGVELGMELAKKAVESQMKELKLKPKKHQQPVSNP